MRLSFALLLLLHCYSGRNNVVKASEEGVAVHRVFESRNDPPLNSDEKLDAILNTVKAVQNDVRNLRQRIKIIDTELFTRKEKKPCKEKDETKDYIVQNCGNNTGNGKDYYTLDGDHGSFEKQGFCRVIIPSSLKIGGSYKISARLYNSIGPQGIHSGYLGLAYNVEDEFNFDYLYIRLHHPKDCYRSGFVQNGNVVTIGGETGTCPDGPPRGRQWFKLQLLVQESAAILYLNGIQVVNLSPHFRVHGRGGVLVANGHRNVIRFNHYQLLPIDTSKHRFTSCKSHSRIGSDYYLMEGEEGVWPRGGFCRSVSRDVVLSKHYSIRVSLYNQVSVRSNGLLGVMFNVHNKYNYDFIYFSLQQRTECYEYGSVFNGVIRYGRTYSGPCKIKPPTNKWFTLQLSVQQDSDSVTMLLNNKEMAVIKSRIPFKGRGGVLVRNGYKNVVMFKKFSVENV